jgi:hypothetical protein
MKHGIWVVLTHLNNALLPKIHKGGQLAGLSKFKLALLGYKRWVVFQRMAHENPADRWLRNKS